MSGSSVARLAELTWSERDGDDALFELAAAAQLKPRQRLQRGELPPALDLQGLSEALEAAARHLGLAARSVDFRYGDADRVLERVGTALITLTDGAERRFLAVLASNAGQLDLLTPDLRRRSVPRSWVRSALVAPLERGQERHVSAWLQAVGIPRRRVARARQGLLDLLLSEQRVGGLCLLAHDPGEAFGQQLRACRARADAASAVAASLAQVAMSGLSWWLIGHVALTGSAEPSWLLGWGLASVSAIALQLTAALLGGRAIRRAAAVLKRRLLFGALRMDPDAIRQRGSGRLLSMVSESEALENAGLSGAFGVVLALVQLAGAAVLLVLGAGGPLHAFALLAWCCVLLGWSRTYRQRRAAWTERRFALCHDFVENLLGHRTRAVQQPARRWHLQEDQLLREYWAASTELDSLHSRMSVWPARGWLLLSVLGLLPVVLMPAASVQSLAVAIGGLLQAYQALGALAAQLTSLGGAWVAWQQIGSLFAAARARPAPGSDASVQPAPSDGGASLEEPQPAPAVLDARGLSFRYEAGGAQVLTGCSLSLRAGDRVLLQGESGGGKSTLAALLVGLRKPDSGQLSLQGLDRQALGALAWRRGVASAPQFHENHLLSASLAFNLLMGRRWPPFESDRQEAVAVCQDLGLSSLLARMPAGLDQVVGETGWQLSHGERSRVFLARALLQRAQVLVLDESFGALDPITLRQCLDATLARAPALIVIAHP